MICFLREMGESPVGHQIAKALYRTFRPTEGQYSKALIVSLRLRTNDAAVFEGDDFCWLKLVSKHPMSLCKLVVEQLANVVIKQAC